MSNSENLSQDVLLASIHPNIVIKNNSVFIATTIVYLLLSALIFYVAFIVGNSETLLFMGLIAIGSALLGLGLYGFLGKRKKRVYIPTGSEIKENVLFFDISKKKVLLSCLDKGIYNDNNFNSCSSGGLRLDLLYSNDGKFAAAQLMEFEPFSFCPVSKIYYYEDGQAIEFQSFIKKISL